MSQTNKHFDALVIGSGQAAKPLCLALGKAGFKTGLIEREHVGGTCVNEGCSPTKTMVASARVAYLARRGADYGVQAGPVTVDMRKVYARKQAIVDSFRSGGEKQLTNTENVELLMGEASFAGAKALDVRLNAGGAMRVTADKIFINAGCRPSMPDVPGSDKVPALNSKSIMELTSVPEHLLVLGGGYIGLEFGQMFRRFGSRVTVVQRSGQLLGREDQDVADEVAKILKQDGLEILLETKAVRIEPGPGGGVSLTVSSKGMERALTGSHVLFAVGRVPNTDKLNLAAAEIRMDDKGFIIVNEKLETNVPGVFALGDIKGGPSFTHISYDDYRIIRANLLDGGQATTAGRLVPYTVFIDPQLGRIGLSEAEAKAKGMKVRVAKIPMTWVARALETDETRGFMKVIVEGDGARILGAAVLGLEGGEIMSAIQIAMMGNMPYSMLRDGIFAHPTLMESLNTLFGSLAG
jgi:pyruvate/2-oxoglutarate dehydrogenase complex dihydrolipoamide dehydrogenase (E3) component